MDKVIIESPFAGDQERNKQYAQRCMLDCLQRGEAPYASHLLYTQVLDDTDPDDRRVGMNAGFEWVKASDKSVVYTDYGQSRGMLKGIEIAKDLGHEVEFRQIGKNPLVSIKKLIRDADWFMAIFSIVFTLFITGLLLCLLKFMPLS